MKLVLPVRGTFYYQSNYNTKFFHENASVSNPDPVQTGQNIWSHWDPV